MTLAAAGAAALASMPAHASEMVYFNTVTNTDVASFSIGQMRDVGTGTLNVSGISGTVTGAYLYWHGPTNSIDPLANAAVSFGGSAITGTNIGFSSDNFWGYNNSQAYRADVTSLVAGSGSYALGNFIKGSYGNLANINGASLIVFYDDGNAANNHDVVLFNGNDGNYPNSYDADSWNATLAGINYTGGPASMTLHVSDGQAFGDGDLLLNGSTIASGNIFNGDTAQIGGGNNINGGLWDVKSFDISSRLTPGANTLNLGLVPGGDALGLIVAQFNLPVGTAPTAPVPEPATWALMILGFGAVGYAMRRRGARVQMA